MNKIKIITDSSSGISQEEGKRLQIGVVPMPVVVDGKDTWHFNGLGLCGAAISATYCF